MSSFFFGSRRAIAGCCSAAMLFVSVVPVLAADVKDLTQDDTARICSYFGDAIPKTITTSRSSSEAAEIIQKIVDASGLVQNFDISAASIPNAAAVTSGGVRRVFYNPAFIERLVSDTGTKWAPVSVLAHEVGHHLNGHSLKATGSRPQLEIEADAFSGFILQRLGASLTETTTVIAMFGTESGSQTHPSRKVRLQAITSGWTKACKKDPDCFLEPIEPDEADLFDDSQAAWSVPGLGKADCDPLDDKCTKQDICSEDANKKACIDASPKSGNEAILHQP